MSNPNRMIANAKRAMDQIETHNFGRHKDRADAWADQAQIMAAARPGVFVIRVSSYKIGSRVSPERHWQVHVYAR